MNFIYKNKYQMSKFSKSLFIIIWIFFYPRFILVMILILTVKPVLKSLLHKYPILFLEYWLESKQYRISYFQVPFILQTQSCVLLPSNPFLPSKNERIATLSLSLKKKKEEEEEKRKHICKTKKSQILFFLKRCYA